MSKKFIEDSLKRFVDFDEADGDLTGMEEWEKEYHARFGGSFFYPYITPSSVRKFIWKFLKQELEKTQINTINKIKDWTKGKKVDKDKLRNYLNEIKKEIKKD